MPSVQPEFRGAHVASGSHSEDTENGKRSPVSLPGFHKDAQ